MIEMCVSNMCPVGQYHRNMRIMPLCPKTGRHKRPVDVIKSLYINEVMSLTIRDSVKGFTFSVLLSSGQQLA